jgi:glycosyltransferase involved in cell wall biosynthesis
VGNAFQEGIAMIASGRIALFLPSLAGGGAERVFVNLANQFVNSGRDVHLILLRCEGPYLFQLDPRVRIVCLNSSSTAAVISLARHLRKDPPAVLVSAMDVFNLIAIVATFIAHRGTPIIITLHLHLSSHARLSKKIHDRVLPYFSGLLYRFASEIIAVSEGVAQDAASIIHTGRKRIRVIHNPVVPRGTESHEQPHPWFNDSVPVIVSAGRFNPQKDYDTLIHAFSRLIECRPARLLLLGEGPDQARIEKLVADLGLTDSIGFPGFVPDPFAFFSCAKAFVLSSHYEGFGMVLLEALSCGCPVISTDCPSGPAEILGDGAYGRLVPVGDVRAMADALVDVLNSPVDREVLAARAGEFSVESVARSYLQIIDHLV